jgi:Rieske Fe-S protein
VTAAGSLLVVGGETHPVGEDPDTTARYAALEEWASTNFRVTRFEQRWSAQDYLSVDGLPYIGALDDDGRLFGAGGFNKWGMTQGAVAAMLIADAVAGRANPWAELFDAKRVEPRAGVGDFVTNNVTSARRAVAEAATGAPPAPSLDDLEPGEGAVCGSAKGATAAFRDDDGRLHTVSPTCAHMGCTVAFNRAERSWDCPCHGSRFTVDGAVIQGPAVADLEAI